MVNFHQIVEVAKTFTCWRPIYPESSKPTYIGRMEDRVGWSFQANLCFAGTDKHLLLMTPLAAGVLDSRDKVRELILSASSSCDPKCDGHWAEELGTIWIWATDICPERQEQLLEVLPIFCQAFKNWLENPNLRLAVKLGGGRLCGAPVDLFNEKYD